MGVEGTRESADELSVDDPESDCRDSLAGIAIVDQEGTRFYAPAKTRTRQGGRGLERNVIG